MRSHFFCGALLVAMMQASCASTSSSDTASSTEEHPARPRVYDHRGGDILWSGHTSGRELGPGGELQIFVDHETHPHASASFAKYTLGVNGGLPMHRHDKTEEYAYIV
ncbi:MAG: hypothetical protein ACYTF7_12180, partial [Planctomycetota bacterium]